MQLRHFWSWVKILLNKTSFRLRCFNIHDLPCWERTLQRGGETVVENSRLWGEFRSARSQMFVSKMARSRWKRRVKQIWNRWFPVNLRFHQFESFQTFSSPMLPSFCFGTTKLKILQLCWNLITLTFALYETLLFCKLYKSCCEF